MKKLHIVSFNVPYPPDYGGVIDVYYKIKALHERGIQISLHCFQYGREVADELNKVCKNVFYYPRKHSLRNFSSFTPYIVKSRKSDELLNNLLKDEAPILFEGLHTCYYLSEEELANRVRAVRLHNVEWDYYRNLGRSERSMLRKFYFFTESLKLKYYEKILKSSSMIFPIAPGELDYLEKNFANIHLLPAFHPNEKISCTTGRGEYALYHGNLSVNENNQAALFLVSKVFNDPGVRLIIAGSNPSPSLMKMIEGKNHISIRANLTEEEMMKLIREAQVNVLPTFQQTGVKLKLLNALYNGRHVLVNKQMVEDTGLDKLCAVTDSAQEMKEKLVLLMTEDFTQPMIREREAQLDLQFSNRRNAELLEQWLFDSPQ